MKNIKLILLGAAMIAVSCEKDETKTTQPEANEFSHLGKEHIMENPVEGNEKGILDGDVFYSYSLLKQLQEEKESSGKLRMERNRINQCRGPRQGGRRRIDMNIRRLNRKARNAVRRAATQLNNLNMGLVFRVVVNQDGARGSRITFLPRDLGGDLGEGTFPVNGNVGHTIRIGNRFIRTSTNTALTNVIIHEIGHNLGFRHSDWNGRVTCPRNGRGVEGVANTFYVFPGRDPSNGRLRNSIMCACCDEEQPMTRRDREAFRRGYPANRCGR